MNRNSHTKLIRWGCCCTIFLLHTIMLCIFHFKSVIAVTAQNTTTTKNDKEQVEQTTLSAREIPDISVMNKILFGALVIMAMEILNFFTNRFGKWINAKQIPVRGKHLDDLRVIDHIYIAFSKANTAPFTYFYLRYCYLNTSIVWNINDISIYNTILPIPILFIIFDFTYTIFHYILHIQFLYPYIHKHHHIQKAPTRGNIDGINVHPIEFIIGEYNHIFSIAVYTTVFNTFNQQHSLHILGTLLFVVLGGILAGLNHTRYDIVIKIFNIKLFDSKDHDVHHRIPQCNYGQYTTLWDRILLHSYRPYNPNDRINPKSQLDPKTGKTISYNNKVEKTQ